jgi:uncharacterized protein (TIGR03067 family)
MKRHAVLILAVGFMLAADGPRPSAKGELAKLQGQWQLVAVERDGLTVPDEHFQGEIFLIQGERLTVVKAGEVLVRATMTFDPTTSPPTFVQTIAEGPHRGQKFHGIYELDGDTLRSCGSSADRERPREFATRNGEKLFVSRRVKP